MYCGRVAPSHQTVPQFVRLAGHALRWRLLTELAGGDLRVRELMTLTGQPQNLISYHLRLLRDGGLITAVRSSFDGRDSYYHLDLDRCAEMLAQTGTALHPGVHPALRVVPAPRGPQDLPVSVLFVCTGNSARSPIAEALLRHHAFGGVEAASAGTQPKPRLHPRAAPVLRAGYGIDISRQRPRHLSTLTGRRFDYLITLCDKAREVCPELVDHIRLVHWSIPDPSDLTGKASYPAFDGITADIDARIRYLLPVLNTKEVQP